jgi:CDP-glucose 4,6-dehydratase
MESSDLKHILKLDGPVLVTGDTGFKGSWLTILLNQLGIETVGMSLPAESGSLFERANLSAIGNHEILDIRDFDAVVETFKKYKPSLIIHLAAQALVIDSYTSPRETFETNVMGTVNILEAARRQKSAAAIGVITTDKVYENKNLKVKYSEGDRLAGKDPYSASKVAAESAVAAWQQLKKEFDGPAVVSLRAGNVIGGGDLAANRLLPDLIRSFLTNSEVLIRNPLSTRPWQHVLDPLWGYLLTLDSILSGNKIPTLNFAPNSPSLSVLEVVNIAKKSWGKEISVSNSITGHQFQEAEQLELNADLARALINWTPRWTQEQAIQATINWWNQVENLNVPAVEACINDINTHQFSKNSP